MFGDSLFIAIIGLTVIFLILIIVFGVIKLMVRLFAEKNAD